MREAGAVYQLAGTSGDIWKGSAMGTAHAAPCNPTVYRW